MNTRIISGYRKISLSELPLSDFVGSAEQRWFQIEPFFKRRLNFFENPKILDVAAGAGHDSVMLKKAGYDVVANEVDDVWTNQAKELAESANVTLEIRNIDWREIDKSDQYAEEEFDVVFSIGNSYPNYLLSREGREQALRGFWKVLKPNGVLFFDARNFDYMLDQADTILADPETNFKHTYNSTYFDKKVKGFPVGISEDRVHFLLKHYENKTYAEVDLWPATIDRVQELVANVLGDVFLEIYYDYTDRKPEHYDFAQFVLRK